MFRNGHDVAAFGGVEAKAEAAVDGVDWPTSESRSSQQFESLARLQTK
jgi:hypothetical protein